MIDGECIVPERMKNQKWPHAFVAVPREGDMVESDEGENLIILKVIHTQFFATSAKPFIKIVLGVK